MIKKLFKIIIVGPILCVLCLIFLFAVFYSFDQLILTPDFFETPEEVAWAKEMSSKEVDFYNAPWASQGTLTISDEKRQYMSPLEKYQLSLVFLKENNEGAVTGFFITDTETGRIVLKSPHWFIHPVEVKWLFNEKYIAYTHSEKDMIGLQSEYVYVGSLKTGVVAKLTTTKEYQAHSVD